MTTCTPYQPCISPVMTLIEANPEPFILLPDPVGDWHKAPSDIIAPPMVEIAYPMCPAPARPVVTIADLPMMQNVAPINMVSGPLPVLSVGGIGGGGSTLTPVSTQTVVQIVTTAPGGETANTQPPPETPVAPVPLPAGGLLLLVALVALTSWRRVCG